MKITSREKEILDTLKKEPLISQEELATRFQISRSSVAVHISNLMKKGMILGKGYIFNEKSSILVFGRYGLEIIIDDSKEDLIDLYFDGFAFRVAKSIVQLGIKAKLITLISNDKIGTELIKQLLAHDIDITYIYRYSHKRSNKVVILNDKRIFQEVLSRDEYRKALQSMGSILLNNEWLIIENDLIEIVMEQVEKSNNAFIPSIATLDFIKHKKKIPDIYQKIDLLVIGANPEEIDSLTEEAFEINKEKNNMIIIILDGKNHIVSIVDSSVNHISILPNQQFDLKTNLPNFLSGVVFGLSSKYSLRQSIRIGIGACSTEEKKRSP